MVLYTTELTSEVKQKLREGPGIEHWTSYLQARFRQRTNHAMAAVARYTCYDARRQQEPQE